MNGHNSAIPERIGARSFWTVRKPSSANRVVRRTTIQHRIRIEPHLLRPRYVIALSARRGRQSLRRPSARNTRGAYRAGSGLLDRNTSGAETKPAADNCVLPVPFAVSVDVGCGAACCTDCGVDCIAAAKGAEALGAGLSRANLHSA